MEIAYVYSSTPGQVDELLSKMANSLKTGGYIACGTVRKNCGRGEHPCDMQLQILPDGPEVGISQNLGKGSKGCRLDPNALEAAATLVENNLNDEIDILIVNKFGKHEVSGRGLCPSIVKAIELHVPVIVGVNALNITAFLKFIGLNSIRLEPCELALALWFRSASKRA